MAGVPRQDFQRAYFAVRSVVGCMNDADREPGKLRAQTFDIDDRGIQVMLREVQSESLIIALKGAAPELRDKIFKNMSQRAAEMMREDLESKGPVRLSEVEAQQKEILQIVRRLADEGQIMLGAKGDDAFV